MINKSDKELLNIMSIALENAKGWAKCRDGSFEMALADLGYWEALKEVRNRGLNIPKTHLDII